MKIVRASIYSVDLPTKGGSYHLTSGFSEPGNQSIIVQLDTDEGISGFGEVCPIGTHYGRGWGGAAHAGLVCRDRELRSRCLIALSDYIRLDTAALLGPGDSSI